MTHGAPHARYRSLDDLRGLAALVVVLHHLSLAVPGAFDRLHAAWLPRILVAGHQAVAVFFVLSGFVLYAALTGARGTSYGLFVGRRLLRLYPPVAAAILGSAALYLLVGARALPSASEWVTAHSWTDRPDARVLAGHLLLLGGERYQSLDNPLWSLIVELRVALVFPLLARGVAARPLPTLALSLAVSVACAAWSGADAVGGVLDVAGTGRHLFLFAAGAWLAREAPRIRAALGEVSPILLLAPAVLLLTADGAWARAATAVGAMMLVAAAASRDELFGRSRIVAWLGSRSFSLYLVHVPVLVALLHLPGVPPGAGPVLLALPLSLAAAELFWRAAERSSLAASRALGRTGPPAHPASRASGPGRSASSVGT